MNIKDKISRIQDHVSDFKEVQEYLVQSLLIGDFKLLESSRDKLTHHLDCNGYRFTINCDYFGFSEVYFSWHISKCDFHIPLSNEAITKIHHYCLEVVDVNNN